MQDDVLVHAAGSGVPFPDRLKPDARPLREKFVIDIQNDDKQELHVTLRVPLDADRPAEAKAEDELETNLGFLEVQYVTELDLFAERKEFANRLAETYKTDVGNIVRRDQLELLNEKQLRTILAPLASQGAS